MKVHEAPGPVTTGGRAARGAALHPPRYGVSTVDSAAPVVQRYRVLGGNHMLGQVPNRRPLWGYPYAIVERAQLVGQVTAAGVGDGHAFLSAPDGDTANLAQAPAGVAMRVSDDHQMAIEDAALGVREPKVFFASQRVVDSSNASLQRVNSHFRLVRRRQVEMKILTGLFGEVTLNAVTPEFDGGSADLAPQNCDSLAARLMGTGPATLNSRGGDAIAAAAKRIAPVAGANLDAVLDAEQGRNAERLATNALASDYVHGVNSTFERNLGINRFASPQVGEAFMIGSLGMGPRRNLGQVFDVESGERRDLNWSFHFAGVVAQSGGDRITLENYARGDNRRNRPDPRWFFQMVGTARSQSFHELQEATRGYANPLTVRVQHSS